MANYIKESLEEGETIILNGRLHWTSIFGYLFWGWLLTLAGACALVGGYFFLSDTLYSLMGGAVTVLGLLVLVCGRVVRTRSEFAVTNSRFIQKDGIFNIKMTEIPLQRIETVNFYQTIWQRLLGTGCVELVGSGGTSHQVHSIEHPMQVRKVIVSTINKIPKQEEPTTATPTV